MPSRCCMPLDMASTRVRVASPRPTSSSRSARSRSPPSEPARRWCSVEQLVGAKPVGEAKQLGQVADRGACLGRARRGRRRPSPRRPRPHEPAGDLHERRLAGAVRAKQPDELAGLDNEVHARQAPPSRRSASQSLAGEGGGHAAESRKLPLPWPVDLLDEVRSCCRAIAAAARCGRIDLERWPRSSPARRRRSTPSAITSRATPERRRGLPADPRRDQLRLGLVPDVAQAARLLGLLHRRLVAGRPLPRRWAVVEC